MMNLLDEGTITVGNDKLRTWQNEEFSPEDLLRYLAGVTMHQDLFNSMESRDISYTIGSDTLIFSTFVLNGIRSMELFRSRYKSTE